MRTNAVNAANRKTVRATAKHATTANRKTVRATTAHKKAGKPNFSHLGTPIRFEYLEPGKRYVARYAKSGVEPDYTGSIISGIFVETTDVSHIQGAESSKPHIVLTSVKEHDGYVQVHAAYVMNLSKNKSTGEIIQKMENIPMIGSIIDEETGGYEWSTGVPPSIKNIDPERPVFLRSDKWVFYPYDTYTVNRMRDLMPSTKGLPNIALNIIGRMSQPTYTLNP
jgi:hypothetical protein